MYYRSGTTSNRSTIVPAKTYLNLPVVALVNCLAWRNKFLISNAFTAEKMFFIYDDLSRFLRICKGHSLLPRGLLFSFWIITVNTGFFSHYDLWEEVLVISDFNSSWCTNTCCNFCSCVSSWGTNFTEICHILKWCLKWYFISLLGHIKISVCVCCCQTQQTFIKFISGCYMFQSHRPSSGSKVHNLKYKYACIEMFRNLTALTDMYKFFFFN